MDEQRIFRCNLEDEELILDLFHDFGWQLLEKEEKKETVTKILEYYNQFDSPNTAIDPFGDGDWSGVYIDPRSFYVAPVRKKHLKLTFTRDQDWKYHKEVSAYQNRYNLIGPDEKPILGFGIFASVAIGLFGIASLLVYFLGDNELYFLILGILLVIFGLGVALPVTIHNQNGREKRNQSRDQLRRILRSKARAYVYKKD